MKVNLKSLFLVLLLALSGSLTAQSSMSLDDCIAYASSNHPDIRIAQLQIADADWRIKENLASGLPQISAGLSYSYFIERPGIPASIFAFGTPDSVMVDDDAKIAFAAYHNLSGNLQLNQLLFSNSYLLGLKAARNYREFVQQQLEVSKNTVRNNVTDAYLPALLLSENLTTLDNNIANLENLLRETRATQEAGFAEQLDVDRLDLSLANLKSERNNLDRQREMVVNALKLTMGMPVGEDITLTDDLEKLLTRYADADLISEVNYMNRPEYLQLLKGRELNSIQVKLYEKTWLPTVAGFIQYQPGFQGGFTTRNSRWFWIPQAIAGISVTVPIWDGGTSKAGRQRAMIALQTVDEQKKMLENAISLEITNARQQYLNAQQRVNNQQKNLDLAQRIYNTTQIKYRSGIGSSFELISAEQGVYQAQAELTQARLDMLNARIAIKRALGNN